MSMAKLSTASWRKQPRKRTGLRSLASLPVHWNEGLSTLFLRSRTARPTSSAGHAVRFTTSWKKFLIARYELINGEIVSKVGHKCPHARTLILIIAWLATLFGKDPIPGQRPFEVADLNGIHKEPSWTSRLAHSLRSPTLSVTPLLPTSCSLLKCPTRRSV